MYSVDYYTNKGSNNLAMLGEDSRDQNCIPDWTSLEEGLLALQT